jgi:hypothetical protein
LLPICEVHGDFAAINICNAKVAIGKECLSHLWGRKRIFSSSRRGQIAQAVGRAWRDNLTQFRDLVTSVEQRWNYCHSEIIQAARRY